MIEKEAYNKPLMGNITKTYEKTYNDINKEAKHLASQHIENRVEHLNKNNTFIILKYHKEKFNNNKKCRLINPAKSEIGNISKSIIEKIY